MRRPRDFGAHRVARLLVGAAGLFAFPFLTTSCEKLVGIEPVVVLAPPEAAPPGVPRGDATLGDGGRAFIRGTCKGTTASDTFLVAGTPELVVLAHYGPSSAVGNDVSVVIDRSKPIVLALAAYSATTWNVSVRANARVERVLLLAGAGGDMSTLVGVAGVPQGTGTTDVSDPSMASNVEAIANEAVRQTGAPLGGYFGCYTATAFEVSDLP